MDSATPLLDLYHADRRLEFIRRRLVDLPGELDALAEGAARQAELRERRAEESQGLVEALERLEHEIGQLDTELARLGRQTSDVSSMDALAANRTAIERCERQKAEFEDKVLVKLEAQEIMAREDELRAERERAETEGLSREQAQLESERGSLLADREETLARRELQIGALDPQLQRRYRRVATGHGHRSLVPLNGGSCGGCGEALPAQQALNIREGGVVLACEGCGRLVIRTES